MITKVFKSGNSMALRIPRELDPVEGEMAIKQEGERWIVTPVKQPRWPRGFFESIRIEDPSFERPDQGEHRDITL